MKRILIILLILLNWQLAAGQQFQKKLTVALDSASEILHTRWLDANNDSLLDIVVATRKSGVVSVRSIYDLLADTLHFSTLIPTGFDSATFAISDLDHDNRMDLIVTGTPSSGTNNITTFLNKGLFNFQSTISPLLTKAPKKIIYSDLDNDGQKEAIILRASKALVVLKNSNNSFVVAYDSTLDRINDFAVADFDGNGFNDIVVSGHDQSNEVILSVLEFKDKIDTLRVVKITQAIEGVLETGDLNHDGLPDFIVSGRDKFGALTTSSFLSSDTTFVPGQNFTGLDKAQMTIADFDSDGQADIAFRGVDNLTIPQNWIHTFSGDSIVLPTSHILDQLPGDFDRDGDLDLLQVTDTLTMVVMENNAVLKNVGPGEPFNSIALRILGRLFVYWEKPDDDHTPTPALTYDLFAAVDTTKAVATEFDLNQRHRLTVSGGNQGSNNYALLKIPGGNYQVQVQAIDNAFFTTVNMGGPGGITPCANITTEPITVCDSNAITLTNPSPQVMWFSLSKGFLGKANTIKLDGDEPDSVFSFIPQQPFSCANIKIYEIKVVADTLTKEFTHTVCETGSVALSVDDEWQQVVWLNEVKTQISTGNNFLYQQPVKQLITAIGKNVHGCVLKQLESIVVSKPELLLNGEGFQIMKGQSVELQASGGESYQWVPPAGLDRTDIPDPVASPEISTRYTVTLTDSIGCKVSGSILVEVSETAFIANLFTPNGDGKNDELRIFGLSASKQFRFRVFSREGNTVFETDDVHLATTQGWNGTVNGAQQPSGVYYWKVEGTDSSGQPLKLNGKRTGSALLLR